MSGDHKLTPYLIVVIHIGCHHHESANPHISHLAPLATIEQLSASIGSKSILCFLLGDVQFQQHVDHPVVLGGLFLYLLEELERIHCINHRYIWCDILHLVGLQMAYEMPFNVIRQFLHLAREFLLMALAENALPLLIGGIDIFGRMEFAHSHQSYTFRKTGFHLLQVTLYIIIHITAARTLVCRPFLSVCIQRRP